MPSTDRLMETRSLVPLSVQLARRWVVDYFNSHDSSVCAAFITPDYALRIGEYVFAGRDTQWLPAVQKQMDQFPGMGMTVHQVLANEHHAAVSFTEHGASGGAGGPRACWSGVAIYHCNGEQLDGCVAQEDYMAHSRQLRSGLPDPIAAPAPAPWDTVSLASDPQAENVVRQWLDQDWPRPPGQVVCDD